MRLTCIAGLSGLPQKSIPVGTAAGSPAGLSLIGWAGGDEALLNLACGLSRFRGVSHLIRPRSGIGASRITPEVPSPEECWVEPTGGPPRRRAPSQMPKKDNHRRGNHDRTDPKGKQNEIAHLGTRSPVP
jgi:hypothetical protein